MKKIYYILILILSICFYGFLIVGASKKEININYKNNFEKNLIRIAENIPPEDGQWWCEVSDGVKMADTVNNEAIDYYSEIFYWTIVRNVIFINNIAGSEFIYNADLEYIENNGKYDVKNNELIKVTLAIHFQKHCNGLCGTGFVGFQKRVVIFNKDSEIIDIIGDGECVASWIS